MTLSDFAVRPTRPGLVIGYATPTDPDLHAALEILVDVLSSAVG